MSRYTSDRTGVEIGPASSGAVSAGDSSITIGGTASAPTVAVNTSVIASRTYVDSAIAGLKWKQSVVVATTANGTLASAFANGQTVDGVVLVTGDRILVKSQSDATVNGIYTVNASGAPTRSTDADSGSELVSAACFVQKGSLNADKSFVCTNDAITLGVTSIAFAEFAIAQREPGVADVYDYGAIGDGTTDDTAAFQAAINSGKSIVKARGTFKLSTGLTMVGSQTLDFAGCEFTVIGSTITTLNASSINDWEIIGPFTATGAGSTVGTSKFINVTSCERWKVTYATVKSIKGWAIYVDGQRPAHTRGESGIIIGCVAESCYVGMEFAYAAGSDGPAAEYAQVIGCKMHACGTGLVVGVANLMMTGGDIVENTIGAIVQSNAGNYGHGAFVGVNFNHNVTGDLLLSQLNDGAGYTFTGCHFYGYDAATYCIRIDRCEDVQFDGCQIVGVVQIGTASGSGLIYFRNCTSTLTSSNAWTFAAYTDTGITDGRGNLVLENCGGVGSPLTVIVTKTADYTLTTQDKTVLVDTTGGDVTITLPPTPWHGQTFTVKKIVAANTLTIARNGNNINRAAANVSVTTNGESHTLVYNLTTTSWEDV